jgi:hypothetical protein
MRPYSARLNRTSSSFVAQCVEVEVVGEGSTKRAALRSLAAELGERLGLVEGSVSPVTPTTASIDFLVLDDDCEVASERNTWAFMPSE